MAEEKPQGKIPPLQKIRDNSCRFVYANGVTIVNTKFDVQMIFGQLILQPDNKYAIHEHTVVAMSPQQAKSFLALVAKRVKDWEEEYGPVSVEEEIHEVASETASG